jgi:hypothetical protein
LTWGTRPGNGKKQHHDPDTGHKGLMPGVS